MVSSFLGGGSGGGVVGRAVLEIVSDTSKAEAGLSRLQRNLAVGAVVGFTAASVGAAKFETRMTKIETLVGINTQTLRRWQGELLGISEATGKGPGELADALFVVTSAGERGAAALDVLESAAKASAIGLGDTAAIARTVTSAMQAWGPESLSAARATDILTAIVREGNLEASSLAGSLGRVLGIASQVGVTFEDVGAFIATFTRLGVSAEESVTALRSTLTLMIRPTKQSSAALAGVGLSMSDLRRIAVDEGLPQALNTLVQAFEGNEEALALVIPNVRALSGVLGTAGAQGEQFDAILRNIRDSTGIVDDGFARVSETAGVQFNRALASLQVTLIALGSVGLPQVASALGVVADSTGMAAAAFSDLPEPVQQLALGLTAVVTVGPLVVLALTRIVTLLNSARLATLGFTAALAANPIALGAVVVALAVGAFAYNRYRRAADEAATAEARLQRLTQELAGLTIEQLREIVADREAHVEQLRTERDAMLAGLRTMNAQSEAARRAALRITELNGFLRQNEQALGAARQQLADAEAAEFALSEATREAAEAASEHAAALEAERLAAQTAADIETLTRAQQIARQLDLRIAPRVLLPSAAAEIVRLFEQLDGLRNAELSGAADVTAALQKQIDAFLGAGDAAGEGLGDAERELTAVEQALLDIATAADRAELPDLRAQLRRYARAAAEAGDETQTELIGRLLDLEPTAENARGALATLQVQFGDLGGSAKDVSGALELFRSVVVADVNRLGGLVETALRRRAQARLDGVIVGQRAERDALAALSGDAVAIIEGAQDAMLGSVHAGTSARIAEIVREARALEQTLAPQIAAIDAQLAALDQADVDARRRGLEQGLALAFDPRERARLEEQLATLERDQERRRLRDRRRDLEGRLSEERGALVDEFQAVLADRQGALDRAELQARETFREATTAFALESATRELLLSNEIGAMGALLDKFVPSWRTAGLDYGEQLIDGIRAAGVETFIASILGQVGRVRALAGLPPEARDAAAAARVPAAAVPFLEQIAALVEGSAPTFVIEGLRENFERTFGVPSPLAAGALITAPTLALLGETAAARPEIVSPEPLLRRIVREEGGGGDITLNARIFLGEREITDIVRVEIERKNEDDLTRGARLAGVRGS